MESSSSRMVLRRWGTFQEILSWWGTADSSLRTLPCLLTQSEPRHPKTNHQLQILGALRVLVVKSSTPQNTSPPDDAPRSPTCSAPAPARRPKSAARLRSPPALAARTALSGPPDSDTPDSRTNSASRDTSDETDRECAESPRPLCLTLRASSYDGIRPAPPPSPRLGRGDTDSACILRLRTGAAFRPMLSDQS